MPHDQTRRSLLFISISFLFVSITAITISLLALGYQIKLGPGYTPTVKATGLLSINSKPKNASVYINDQLTTTTDDTVNLPPDSYHIKVLKDDYLPWTKNVEIKKESVYLADIQLFRIAPNINPATNHSVINPVSSPDHLKIVYGVDSLPNPSDNGLYLIEFSSIFPVFNKTDPRQIAKNTTRLNWSDSTIEFSPDSRQMLIKLNSNYYLISDYSSAIDIANNPPLTTKQLSSLRQQWSQQLTDNSKSQLAKLPPPMLDTINTIYSDNGHLSLYLGKDGFYYTYDTLEKTSFQIVSSKQSSTPFWLPGSTSLVFTEGDTIKATDYDGNNKVTIYSGKINRDFVCPWPNGHQLIIASDNTLYNLEIL